MSASGPAVDREPKWLRPAHYQAEFEQDTQSSTRQATTALHHNKSLQEENEHLKEVISRMKAELQRYLESGKVADSAEGKQGEPEPVLPWETSSSAYTPLLQAYDQRISELTSALKRYAASIEQLRDNCAAVVAENETLRNDLDEALHRLLERSERDGGTRTATAVVHESAGMGKETKVTEGSGLFGASDTEELYERCELLKRENSVLEEERAALQEAYNEARTRLKEYEDEEMERTQREASLRSQFDSLDAERARAIAEANACKKRLLECETGRKEAERMARDRAAELQEKTKAAATLNKALSRQKGVIQELKSKLSASVSEFNSTIDRLKSRNDELQQELYSSNERANAATREISQLKSSLSNYKQDVNGMVAVMDSLEKKNKELTAEVSRRKAEAEEAAERCESAGMERDALAAREAQSRREVARLLDKRRRELAEAAAHEAESIANVRARLQAAIQSKTDALREANERIAELISERDRMERAARSGEREMERICNAASEEQNRLHVRINELQRSLSDGEERWAEKDRETEERVRVAEARVKRAEEERVRAGVALTSAEERARSAEARETSAMNQTRSLEARIKEWERRVKRVEEEMQRERGEAMRTMQEKMEALRLANEECARLKEQERAREHSYALALNSERGEIARVEREGKDAINNIRHQFEQKLHRLHDQYSEARVLNSELQRKVLKLNHELVALREEKKEAERALEWEIQVREGQETAASARAQRLSSALAAEEARATALLLNEAGHDSDDEEDFGVEDMSDGNEEGAGIPAVDELSVDEI